MSRWIQAMGYEVTNHAILHSFFETSWKTLLNQFANVGDDFVLFRCRSLMYAATVFALLCIIIVLIWG